MVCRRCGKQDHTGFTCKAPFRQAWRGQPAMVLLLRAANGTTQRLETPLTPELYALCAALLLVAIAQKEDK